MFGTIKAAVLAAGLLAVGGGIGVQSGGDGSKTGPGAGSGKGDAVARVEPVAVAPKAEPPKLIAPTIPPLPTRIEPPEPVAPLADPLIRNAMPVGPKQLMQRLDIVKKRMVLAEEAIGLQQATVRDMEVVSGSGTISREEVRKAMAVLIEKRDRVLVLESEVVEIQGQIRATEQIDRNPSLPMPMPSDPLLSERPPTPRIDPAPIPIPMPVTEPRLGVPVQDTGPAQMARTPDFPADWGRSLVPFVAPEPKKKSEMTQNAEAHVQKLTGLLKTGAVTGLDLETVKFGVVYALMIDELSRLLEAYERAIADLRKAGALVEADALEVKAKAVDAMRAKLMTGGGVRKEDRPSFPRGSKE